MSVKPFPIIWNRFTVLFTAAVLLVCSSIIHSSPLRALDTPIERRQVTSRLQCNVGRTYNCHFYSHCIEPSFPCLQHAQDFAITYAQERCNAIANLRYDGSGCQNCISDGRLVMWAYQTEKCFQRKLLNLVQLFENQYPNPQSCLELETLAIAEMNTCYNSSGKLQQILSSNPWPNTLIEDVTKVVKSLRIGGDYFNGSVVDRGVPEAIRSYGHTELAQSLVAEPVQPVRALLCIALEIHDSNGDDVPASKYDFIDALSEDLDRPSKQFTYNRLDYEDQCMTIGANAGEEYHLISWFTNSSDPHIAMNRYTGATKLEKRQDRSGVFFELNSVRLQSSQCGDGMRQAGEACDFSGQNSIACDVTCQVNIRFDCSAGRMTESECWRQVCGDGKRSRSEQCDDGNDNVGDGCNTLCQVEETFTCSSAHNRTSRCFRAFVPQRATILATDFARSRTASSISNSGSRLEELVDTSTLGLESSGVNRLRTMPVAYVISLLVMVWNIFVFIHR